MQTEDQVAEWLVRWEEAMAAGQPPPSLDELPPDMHDMAREGMSLVRRFATTISVRRLASLDSGVNRQQKPPDTPRYRFKAFLAQGGMGEVWRGHDCVLQREVALKVLRARAIAGAEVRARFEEEARYVGQLEHPSIVPVYDVGVLSDGRPYFAMKLVNGHTLAELLKGQAAAVGELPHWVAVFEQVCQAVAFAHSRGVIHRDLKPSNVMLGEFGEVQVMDWGIAKALVSGLTTQAGPTPPDQPPSSPPITGFSDTQPGQVKGTPAYMAPEQARGELARVGKASDVFGLGGTLCAMLTGCPPFTQIDEALAGDLSGAFARLDACLADRELIELAKRCLAAQPEARPADAGVVAQQVKDYRAGVAVRLLRAERERGAAEARAAQMQLAGLGELLAGASFPPAAEEARSRLRWQALSLIRAEVEHQAKLLADNRPTQAATARQVLEFLQALPTLAGVREPEGLAILPEPERHAWQAFWQEVEGLLQRQGR
jgi:tRNA A-37 threonylcarbamoyl transferase component Bud32